MPFPGRIPVLHHLVAIFLSPQGMAAMKHFQAVLIVELVFENNLLVVLPIPGVHPGQHSRIRLLVRNFQAQIFEIHPERIG